MQDGMGGSLVTFIHYPLTDDVSFPSGPLGTFPVNWKGHVRMVQMKGLAN